MWGELRKRTYLYSLCLVVCMLLIIFGDIYAQNIDDPLLVKKLEGTINFDGVVDEAVWQQAEVLPMTMHWPDFAGTMTERTEFRVLYSNEYLYIGAIAYDKDIEKIQNITYKRDAWNEQMDQIALVLDPFNDNENALVFVITSIGSRVDATIVNDAQGNAVSLSWNSYWDALSFRNENSWQAEIRIPFSSLRFQEKNGEVEMGLGLYRYIPRKKEMHVYPAIRPDWGYWSFTKPSQLQTVRFEGIQSNRPWYISPYVLGGTGFHYEEDDLGNWEKKRDEDLQIGLDIQHAFSDNLNADFTVNTDFAQVEADDQTVNLSRYSIFFPEKRRFFLERSSTFAFNTDFSNTLFYSRRIGINSGERVPLLGGVRLVGRFNNWDVGFINMQSRKKNAIDPENFGVLRIRRNVFNDRSYMGGIVTSRIESNGQKNYAYGFDGLMNVFGEDYLKFNLAQSQDSQDPTGSDGLDRLRTYIQWQTRQSRGFGYELSYSSVGEDYNPGLGFERRYNFSQISGELNYLHFAPESSPLRQLRIGLAGETSFTRSSSTLETRSLQPSIRWEWNRGNSILISAEYLKDRVPDAFALSDDITITPREYENFSFALNYEKAPVRLVTTQIGLETGRFYSGKLFIASLTPRAVLNSHFQLSGLYQYSYIDFDDMGQKLISHLARIRIDLSLNVRWSFATFAQLNSLNDVSLLNFRMRFNPKDGNDLYLVFNEFINNDPRSVIPNLPSTQSRTLLVKYIYTFR